MWYYAEGGQRQGPVPKEEIESGIAAGRLTPDTLVWTEGMEDWGPAADHFAFPASASPMPPRAAGPAGEEPPVATEFAACVRQGFERFADFKGRSNRPEYWWFALALFLGSAVATILDNAILGGNGFLNGLYQIVVLIPAIAAGVRRLHDTGRTGWWMLLAFIPILGTIILIYFFIQPGQGDNAWGRSRRPA